MPKAMGYSAGLASWNTTWLSQYPSIPVSQYPSVRLGIHLLPGGIIVQNRVSGLLHTNPGIVPLPDGYKLLLYSSS